MYDRPPRVLSLPEETAKGTKRVHQVPRMAAKFGALKDGNVMLTAFGR